MTKKVINQNTKLNQELINTIEPKFIFDDKPINRFNILEAKNGTLQINKEELLKNLKDQISDNDSKVIPYLIFGIVIGRILEKIIRTKKRIFKKRR